MQEADQRVLTALDTVYFQAERMSDAKPNRDAMNAPVVNTMPDRHKQQRK